MPEQSSTSWEVSDPPHQYLRAVHLTQAQEEQQEFCGFAVISQPLIPSSSPTQKSGWQVLPATRGPGWILKEFTPAALHHLPSLFLIYSNWPLLPLGHGNCFCKVTNSFCFAKNEGPLSVILRDLSPEFVRSCLPQEFSSPGLRTPCFLVLFHLLAASHQSPLQVSCPTDLKASVLSPPLLHPSSPWSAHPC